MNSNGFVLDRKSAYRPMNAREITSAVNSGILTNPGQIKQITRKGLLDIEPKTFDAFGRGSTDLNHLQFAVEKGPFAGIPISMRTASLDFGVAGC